MNRNRKMAMTAAAAGMAAVLGVSPVMAAENGISKEETVYVNADANGNVQEVIVSDWLKNSGTETAVSDVSELENIKNVKGDETFTQDGTEITWNTEDKDIYYQGTSTKDLPVSVNIRYYLDGEEITAQELAGKSGHAKLIHHNILAFYGFQRIRQVTKHIIIHPCCSKSHGRWDKKQNTDKNDQFPVFCYPSSYF